MIDKRLIGMMGDSKRYIAKNVALQWLALAANVAMIFAVSRYLGALYDQLTIGDTMAGAPNLPLTLGIVAAALYPLSVHFFGLSGALMVSLVLLLALIVWYVFWMRARIPDVGVSFFGAAYCGMLLSGLVVVRQALPHPWGGVLVLGIFFSVWANDSFAYLVGSKFGKHKLAPVVSPKKTVEGAVGGVVGGAVLVLIAAVIMNRTLDLEMPLWSAVVLGAVGAVLGEIGDLSFSVIKRQTGIKDYGHIFPGHGGVLDRFDSVLFVAPFAELLFRIIW